MEKKKTTAEIVLSLGEIVLGNIMYAAAVVLFIVPNGLITGGTTGLALFVNHSIGIPISLFVSVFNAVSYTHLDVYKRQPTTYLVWPSLTRWTFWERISTAQ